MTTDKTPATLATAKHGGCVQLGGGLLPCPFCGESLTINGAGDGVHSRDSACILAQQVVVVDHAPQVEAWNRRALSAQPSPGGQDALLESLVARWRKDADEIGASNNTLCQKIANCTMRHAAELQAALAARQPVCATVKDSLTVGGGQAVGAPAIDYEDLLDQAKDLIHCGCSINGAFDWLLEQLTDGEALASPPAQAVDLPYSLDADPAGIRARVADVITGTLMVAAQGHTPPPAGHWAQPFWQAARHDAARSLNVTLRLRELVAASTYMRDRVVETRGVKCMDDLDHAIDEAEKALIDSHTAGGQP